MVYIAHQKTNRCPHQNRLFNIKLLCLNIQIIQVFLTQPSCVLFGPTNTRLHRLEVQVPHLQDRVPVQILLYHHQEELLRKWGRLKICVVYKIISSNNDQI